MMMMMVMIKTMMMMMMIPTMVGFCLGGNLPAGHDDDNDDGDIYIMVECISVTKVIISKVGISPAKLTIYI